MDNTVIVIIDVLNSTPNLWLRVSFLNLLVENIVMYVTKNHLPYSADIYIYRLQHRIIIE